MTFVAIGALRVSMKLTNKMTGEVSQNSDQNEIYALSLQTLSCVLKGYLP